MRNGKAPARTGRGGGGSRAREPGSIVPGESKGDPDAVNAPSGAGGQFLNQVWAGGAGSSYWGC
jgi:hypothetical protein